MELDRDVLRHDACMYLGRGRRRATSEAEEGKISWRTKPSTRLTKIVYYQQASSFRRFVPSVELERILTMMLDQQDAGCAVPHVCFWATLVSCQRCQMVSSLLSCSTKLKRRPVVFASYRGGPRVRYRPTANPAIPQMRESLSRRLFGSATCSHLQASKL